MKRSVRSAFRPSVPGVSVAQVAHHYSMNANLLFKWLRDERFAPGVVVESGPAFLPVEVCRDILVDPPVVSNIPSVSSGRLQIELSGGHRVIAEGGFDAYALGRLTRATPVPVCWPISALGLVPVYHPGRASIPSSGP